MRIITHSAQPGEWANGMNFILLRLCAKSAEQSLVVKYANKSFCAKSANRSLYGQYANRSLYAKSANIR